MKKQLVVRGGPPLALRTWIKATTPAQQWLVGPAGKPPGGAGHTLQIGKSADGKGYLPSCPADPCCLAAHYDVVPDGDGGWSLVVAVTAVSMLYICGGLHLGRKRGLCAHIHIEQARQVWGLVQDGWAFVRSRGSLRPTTVPTSDGVVDAAAESSSTSVVDAAESSSTSVVDAAESSSTASKSSKSKKVAKDSRRTSKSGPKGKAKHSSRDKQKKEAKAEPLLENDAVSVAASAEQQRMLEERRDQTVHSSMAKVEVLKITM
jgi:hypothetical protein